MREPETIRGSGARRRPTAKEPAEAGPARALGPIGGAALALAAFLAFALAWPGGSSGPAVASPPPRASALGNPGESVELSGTVIEVIKTKKTVVLRRGKATTIEVQFLDTDLTGIRAGETLRVTGILRDIRAGDVYRVQGLTFGRD